MITAPFLCSITTDGGPDILAALWKRRVARVRVDTHTKANALWAARERSLLRWFERTRPTGVYSIEI